VRSRSGSPPTGLSSFDLPEHAARNRESWNRDAVDYVEPGERNWAQDEIDWGIWDVPESEIGALADVELDGKDVVELGCGTAYFSAWFARRGARPVGVDLSEAQLETARRLQREHRLEFPLVHASAEDVPLPDLSFDVAFSEYGASIWCDPDRWIGEAARLLRPGGRLVFLRGGTIQLLCAPDGDEQVTDRLVRDYRDLARIEWEDDGSVEFHPGFGELVRILVRSGFQLEDVIDVFAPEGATTRYEWASAEWARRWPSEEIWKARKIAQ
jgi:SAM-dependent methyltransferase